MGGICKQDTPTLHRSPHTPHPTRRVYMLIETYTYIQRDVIMIMWKETWNRYLSIRHAHPAPHTTHNTPHMPYTGHATRHSRTHQSPHHAHQFPHHTHVTLYITPQYHVRHISEGTAQCLYRTSYTTHNTHHTLQCHVRHVPEGTTQIPPHISHTPPTDTLCTNHHTVRISPHSSYSTHGHTIHQLPQHTDDTPYHAPQCHVRHVSQGITQH